MVMLDDFMNCITTSVDIGKKIYIVGYGNFGRKVGKWLINKNIAVSGYIDADESKQESDNVLSYATIQKLNKLEHMAFIISSDAHKKEMIENLSQYGITNNQIVWCCSRELINHMMEDLQDVQGILSRNAELKTLCKDDTCFIIGNGPSLRIEDLNAIKDLKNITTFGCNGIYALYDKTMWRPDIYVCWDPIACESYFTDRDIFDRINYDDSIIVTSLLQSDRKVLRDMGNVYYLRVMETSDGLTFSEDICDCAYASGTVAYGMLQVACYMGFKRIILLGIDCNYTHEIKDNGDVIVNDIASHNDDIELEEKQFYEKTEKRFGYHSVAYIDKQFAGYLMAKEYADKNGIDIINATRGGKLEVFRRQNFDEIINELKC